jgi:glycosyltransferase involved in cell wall biosynthesis
MRQKLLHIIPYESFVPPKNGGALRCYHLCVELSKYYEVTLLTYQDKATIKDVRFETITVVNPDHSVLKTKSGFSKIKNALRYRWYRRSLNGPAEAAVLAFYPLIKKLAKTHEFDVVLMEHLSSMQLGQIIKRYFPKTLRIVDQHNIDHLLFAQDHDVKINNNHRIFERLKQQEEQIHKYADYFWACSQYDLNVLEKLNDFKIKGFVVPNGTSIELQPDASSKNFSLPNLLFCGSLDYPPNQNGLLWFYEKVWHDLKKAIPHVKLTVIGRNPISEEYRPLKEDSNINFIGEVESVVPYYLSSSMAIVPLLQGSGTRLKILEAMSLLTPVISTTIGAQGIDYTENNIIIADTPEDFLEKINTHLSNDILEVIANNALNLIKEKYDWQVITKNAHEELTGIIH